MAALLNIVYLAVCLTAIHSTRVQATTTGALVHGLDFCDPGSWTAACHSGYRGRKDLYCLEHFEPSRRVLLDYCERHRWSMQQQPDTQKFIVGRFNPDLGWGNRLSGISSAFLLALATNRTFLLDFPLFYDLFNPPLNFTVPSAVDGLSSKPVEPHTEIDEDVQIITQDYAQVYADYPVWVVANPGDYFAAALSANPHYQSWVARHFPTYELFWPLAHVLLRPAPRMLEQANAFMQQQNMAGTYTVGVQVRLHKSFPGQPQFIGRFMELARALALQHGHGRAVRFFVTGDDARVYEQAGRILGASAVWSQAANETKARTSGDNPGTEFSALLDMWLLAQCSDVVGSHSSSYVGIAAAWGGVRPHYVSGAERPGSSAPFFWHQTNSDPCFYGSNWLLGSKRSTKEAAALWAAHPLHLQHEQCHWDVVEQYGARRRLGRMALLRLVQ